MKPVDHEYPTGIRDVRALNGEHKSAYVHVKSLLYHDRVSAVKHMSVIGNIAMTSDRFVKSSRRMEHGKCAVRWLPRARSRC